MAVIWLLMKYRQQEKFYLERDWEKCSFNYISQCSTSILLACKCEQIYKKFGKLITKLSSSHIIIIFT